jgi:hypothetical protein
MEIFAFLIGIVSPMAGNINGEVAVWLGKDDGLIYRHETVNDTDSGLGPQSKSILEFFYGDQLSIGVPG